MRVTSLLVSLALALVAFSLPISESLNNGQPSTSGAPSAVDPKNLDVNHSGAFIKGAEQIAEAAKGSPATGALGQVPADKGAAAPDAKQPAGGASGPTGALGDSGKTLGARAATEANQGSAIAAAAEGVAEAAKGSPATGALGQVPARKGGHSVGHHPGSSADALGGSPSGKTLGARAATEANQGSAIAAAAEEVAKAAADQVVSVKGVDQAAGAASKSKPV